LESVLQGYKHSRKEKYTVDAAVIASQILEIYARKTMKGVVKFM
jgi:hypothetical protein